MKPREFAVWMLVLSLSGCGAEQGSRGVIMGPTGVPPANASDSTRPAASGDALAESGQKVPHRIVRTGELRFAVDNRVSFRDSVQRQAADYGGYVSEDTELRNGPVTEQVMVVRMPPEHFEPFLNQISTAVGNFDSRRIQAIDVTDQFVDLEARLKARRDTEARFVELLKQASDVDAILKIVQQMDSLRAEIEVSEGRLRLLRDQEAFSTLRLSFYEVDSGTSALTSRLEHSFLLGWRGLLNCLVAISVFWPLAVAGLLWLFWRHREKPKVQATN